MTFDPLWPHGHLAFDHFTVDQVVRERLAPDSPAVARYLGSYQASIPGGTETKYVFAVRVSRFYKPTEKRENWESIVKVDKDGIQKEHGIGADYVRVTKIVNNMSEMG